MSAVTLVIFVAVARLLLVVILAVAGLAKLGDRDGSRQALMDFGVPAALASPLGVLLPVAELALALALLPGDTARWGAVGACALFSLFALGIAASVARGRRPDCHCFGRLYSAPAGWPVVGRNALLAGIAALVVWGEAAGATASWPSDVRIDPLVGAGAGAGLLMLALLAVQAWFILHLLRQHGRILLRLDALEGRTAREGATPPARRTVAVGVSAPGFSLLGLDGKGAVTLESLLRVGKPVLLTFVDPGCSSCRTLLPELRVWQRDHADRMTIGVISLGEPEANRLATASLELAHVLLQRDQEVIDAYGVTGTPSAVVVQPDGRIGSPLAEGVEGIRQLVSQVLAAHRISSVQAEKSDRRGSASSFQPDAVAASGP